MLVAYVLYIRAGLLININSIHINVHVFKILIIKLIDILSKKLFIVCNYETKIFS